LILDVERAVDQLDVGDALDLRGGLSNPDPRVRRLLEMADRWDEMAIGER
jgi:hypothetical protein